MARPNPLRAEKPRQEVEQRSENNRLDSSEETGPVGDMIRRLAAMGLSSFFTTETALRKAFGDTVPKDWVDFANDQSERGRQEFFDRMASELRKAIDQVDIVEVMESLLTDRTIEIKTKIRIHPRENPAQGERKDSDAV